MKQPDKAHAAWRKLIAYENVHAAHLHAKHRIITARLAAKKPLVLVQLELQLELPLEEKTA